MEPTIAQLKTLYRVCLQASNLLQEINMTRLDERTRCIYMIVKESLTYDGIKF